MVSSEEISLSNSGHLIDALNYQADGVPVIPLQPYKTKYFKQKGSTGKKAHALRTKALAGKLLSPEDINSFWDIEPYANLGFYAGKELGITVIRTHNLDDITGKQTLANELGGEALELLLGLAVQVHVPFGLGTFMCFKYCPEILPELLGDGWKDLGLELFNRNNYPIPLPPSLVEDPHRKEQGFYSGSFRLEELEVIPLSVIQFFNSLPKGKYFSNKDSFRPPSSLSTANGPRKKNKKGKWKRTKAKQTWTDEEVASNLNRRDNSWELVPNEDANSTFHDRLLKIKQDHDLLLQLKKDGAIDESIVLDSQLRLNEDVLQLLANNQSNRYWVNKNGLLQVKYQGMWYWVCTPGKPFHGREVKPTPEELEPFISELSDSFGASTKKNNPPKFIDRGKDEFGRPVLLVFVEKLTSKGERRKDKGRWFYVKLDEPLHLIDVLYDSEGDIPVRKPRKTRSIRRTT